MNPTDILIQTPSGSWPLLLWQQQQVVLSKQREDRKEIAFLFLFPQTDPINDKHTCTHARKRNFQTLWGGAKLFSAVPRATWSWIAQTLQLPTVPAQLPTIPPAWHSPAARWWRLGDANFILIQKSAYCTALCDSYVYMWKDAWNKQIFLSTAKKEKERKAFEEELWCADRKNSNWGGLYL